MAGQDVADTARENTDGWRWAASLSCFDQQPIGRAAYGSVAPCHENCLDVISDRLPGEFGDIVRFSCLTPFDFPAMLLEHGYGLRDLGVQSSAPRAGVVNQKRSLCGHQHPISGEVIVTSLFAGDR